MLRLVLTEKDISRVRVATAPDPMWEITNSLDRLQTRRGRWAYAHWHRTTLHTMVDADLTSMVRSMLIPLLPRASYFPDFLTPSAAMAGLDTGLEAILATSPARVAAEVAKLAAVHDLPRRLIRLPEADLRGELVDALRHYHRKVIEPHEETIQAAIDGDRAVRARGLLTGGIDGLLDSYRPMMRWNRPVLEVAYPFDRTVELTGDGLVLVPSYFCWEYPVTLADPELPPVLIYPVLPTAPRLTPTRKPVTALLGSTRAAVLAATVNGLTTGEIARLAGISSATASHHIGVLRDNNLITSRRTGPAVLHMVTPLGAAVLSAGQRPA